MDWNDIQAVSDKILSHIPQQKPFRFVDRIIEIDENYVCGSYRFKEDEYCYQGHFPGKPVTPGVILTETMAQIGLCSLSLYLLLKDGDDAQGEYTTVFTDADVEFSRPVLPGEEVTVKSRKVFWRRRKLRCECELYLANGDLAARGTLSGMGVKL